MSTGEFFSMSDEEKQEKAKTRQSGRELQKLKSEFLGRAKQFMDDSAIGEGRKRIESFVKKLQGDEYDERPEEAQTVYAEVPEEDWDDEDYEVYEEKEELDWNRPEYIRAGYAKPGTVVEELKTLEEAQEESFGLKMGNLSGLLSRFGSEDASPEDLTQEQTAGVALEIDKPLFKELMGKVYASLNQQVGHKVPPEFWLHPEILILLRKNNKPLHVLKFAMAALFTQIEENYLTESDRDWLTTLLQHAEIISNPDNPVAGKLLEQKGLSLNPEEVQRQLEQTFVFAVRAHRLYHDLVDSPPQIRAEDFEFYRQNLVKIYIFKLAERYDADPENIIRTLASLWQESAQALQKAWEAAKPIAAQHERFQQRKMKSSSTFQKLLQAERKVLKEFEHMQELALEIEGLKQVTRLIEEEAALEKLKHFQTQAVLDAEACLGNQSISLLELRERFVGEQFQETRNSQDEKGIDAFSLSSLEQKRAIGRAKEGEIKSLRRLHQYKQWLLQSSHEPTPGNVATAPTTKSESTENRSGKTATLSSTATSSEPSTIAEAKNKISASTEAKATSTPAPPITIDQPESKDIKYAKIPDAPLVESNPVTPPDQSADPNESQT